MDKLLKKLENGREFRFIQFRLSDAQNENEVEEDKKKCLVRGYATTFNEFYSLLDMGQAELKESVDSRAFDECDMSDVIFQMNHEGRVYARTRNNTLKLSTDEHGLLVEADLSGTEEGRKLYEEIKGGYIDRMSFGFVVDDEDVTSEQTNDKTIYYRTIKRFKKLYDVSAVSIPANDGTEISARSYLDGAIKDSEAERLQKAEEERKLKIEEEERERKIVLLQMSF